MVVTCLSVDLSLIKAQLARRPWSRSGETAVAMGAESEVPRVTKSIPFLFQPRR